MGSQAIQGQWSLNEASSSVYGLARGVLQAATSDNVQPLAILACEQFGNTLAISQETRLKIERTVLPTPEPVSLQFLKLKVGFLKHDCAVQLGSNQAGLRFLALAATLISSLPPFSCAQALASMLEATSTNNQYLPTTRHLTDLVSSLEGRCRLAGFADVVYGYHSIINGVARARGLPVNEKDPLVPDSRGLTTLVDVFRQMQRIGEHEVASVVVEACASAAWIAAFSKWSLETPPSIYLADGTPVTPQPGSKVTLMVICESYVNEAGETARQKAIKVTKRFKTKSLQDLITESSCFPNPSYRIKFETFTAQIQDICGRHEWEKKAIFAAVPLAIRLVLEHVDSTKGLIFPKELGNVNHSGDRPSIRPWTATKPSSFPEIGKVFKTMSLILGLSPDFPSEMLASAKSFRDLQEVENYFDYTSSLGDSVFSCPPIHLTSSDFGRAQKVPWWTKDNSTQSTQLRYKNRDGGWIAQTSSFPGKMRYVYSSNAQMPTPEKLHRLIQALGFICHIILLLSLFDNLTDVLFVPPRYYWFNHANDSELFKDILAILASGVYSGNICASKVFLDVCQLLLHDNHSTRAVIMKSGQSDCFWLSALDTPLLSTCGYLSIISCRGRIIHGRELYNEVYDEVKPWSYDDAPGIEGYLHPPELVTHQPFSKFHLQWQIKTDEACLIAGLSVINGENVGKVYKSYPSLQALNALAYMLVVNCEHAVPSSLDQSKARWKPRSGSGLPIEAGSNVRVFDGTIYPMGGNRGLQMYCLGLIGDSPDRRTPDFGIALRQKACFDCCVKACEEYKCRRLIL
ncbi:hypothetical protein F5B21DRAFT_462973 [Xylaria acuta]|nr:hypothetical protein F5B21DRAFT_462973 [Xylaria acuta]